MKLRSGMGLVGLLAASVAVAVLCTGTAFGATAAKKTPAKAPARTPAKPAAKPSAKPATKPATKPAPVTWVTKTAGRATFSVPSSWKQDKSTPPQVSAWCVGEDTQAPDAGFAIMWVDVPMDALLNSEEIKKLGQSTVSGIAVTEYSPGSKVEGVEGFVLVADKPDADGKRLVISAVSMTGQFKKHEATMRKIVASVKIKETPVATPEEKTSE